MATFYTYSEGMSPGRYHYCLSWLNLKQHSTVMAADIFKFTIRLSCNPTNPSNSTIPTLVLFYDSQPISCQDFFQEGQVFLRTFLSHPFISIEFLDEIIDGVVSAVKELFQSNTDASHPLESHQHQEIPVRLHITLFGNYLRDEPPEVLIPDLIRIPASERAIQTSLKKANNIRQNELCSICLEHMNVNDEGHSTMPCNHVFHQRCIVTWLRNSHMCPLCRYPLPTINT